MIVACEAEWPNAPTWVRVVAGAGSRGDLLDRASSRTDAEFIGFLRAGVTPGPEWRQRAVELLEDPRVAAVGGPQLARATAPPLERAAWYVLSSRMGAGPFSHRFQRQRARPVQELFTSNLVVRASSFNAVGGFQSPSPRAEEARLGFKLRSLTAGRIVCHPDLAVEAEVPRLFGALIGRVFGWGRHRGELLRRLRETSGGAAYLAPPLALLTVATVAALAAVAWPARLALLVVGAAYVVAGTVMIARAGPRVGIPAALALPLVHAAYALGLWRGYLSPSLGVVRPHREQVAEKVQGEGLRILVLNWRDVTHPWAGGAEAYMHELARRWVANGCRVTWLTQRHRGAPPRATIDGIDIHRRGGNYTQYPRAALAYLAGERKRCDVIVDCENGIPFFGLMYSRKPVVLVVHHLHGEIFRRELPALLRWVPALLEGALMPRVYRRAPVVTVSPSTVADLVASGYDRARLHVVANGVSLPASQPRGRAEDPLLVHLGRLKAYKSVDVILRAMPAVLEQCPTARLAIAGQGPEREQLERLTWSLGLAASVRFHGYVDATMRQALLEEAWVAVCASAFEGFGVVCLEANAHGTPVVAANVSGLRDAVLDGRTGVLVPYGDPAALAFAVTALLRDRGRREQMAPAARRWAKDHDWEGSAASFQALLESLAPAAPAAPGAPGDAASAVRGDAA